MHLGPKKQITLLAFLGALYRAIKEKLSQEANMSDSIKKGNRIICWEVNQYINLIFYYHIILLVKYITTD